MKLLIFLTVVSCLQVSAKGYSQTVTLTAKNTSLEKVFKEVTKQTGFTFVYTRSQLKNSQPVTVNFENTELRQALSICFRDQPLSYVIEDKYVIVQTISTSLLSPSTTDSLIDIKGRVMNESGEPLAGATYPTDQVHYKAII